MINKHYDDWQLLQLDCNVKECKEIDGMYYVELDDTIFFFESGGQHNDSGTIDGIEVLDLVKKDDKYYHVLAKPVSGKVHLQVNSLHRIIQAQIHTMSHVMCSLINKKYNAKTIAFYNDEKQAYAEMGFAYLDDELIKQIETQCNGYIRQDLKVEISYPDKEEVLGKVKDEKLNHEQLRCVKIGDVDFDMCACIHVPSLRYLQMFKIYNYEKTNRGYKLYFKVGEMLLTSYQENYDQLHNISKLLSNPLDNCTMAVEKLNNDLGILKHDYQELNERYLDLKAKEFINSKQEIIIEEFNDENRNIAKLANIIINASKKSLFFINYQKDSMHLIVASSKENAQILFKELANKYQIKGGGNPKLCQGSTTKNTNIVGELKEKYGC